MNDFLDLRVFGDSGFRLTRGKSYNALTWNIPNAPEAFTITMQNWDNGEVQTWTIGNGITKTGDNIIWNLGEITQPKGKYYGKIASDSIVFGVAFENRIIISVE